MAFLGRVAGGGFFANKINSRIPELLLTLPIGYCALLTYSYFMGQDWISYLVAVVGWQVAYWSYEMGHGTIYNMTGWNSKDPNRKQSMEYLIRPIFNLFKWDYKKPSYSWACMGLKGICFGLPIFPLGLLMGLFLPLGYWIGSKTKGTSVGEWFGAGSAGLLVVLHILIFKFYLTSI